MRALLAVVALAFCATQPQAARAQNDDPMARVRDGAVECYTPDHNKRTCRATSTYRFLDGGRIVNDAIVFLQHDPRVLMYVSSDVFVRNGMICGAFGRAELDAAHFEIDGVRAAAEEANAIRDAIAPTFAGIREICSRYTPDGDGAAVTAFADGVERPEFADRMIWIRPEDGFTIGAAETSAT